MALILFHTLQTWLVKVAAKVATACHSKHRRLQSPEISRCSVPWLHSLHSSWKMLNPDGKTVLLSWLRWLRPHSQGNRVSVNTTVTSQTEVRQCKRAPRGCQLGTHWQIHTTVPKNTRVPLICHSDAAMLPARTTPHVTPPQPHSLSGWSEAWWDAACHPGVHTSRQPRHTERTWRPRVVELTAYQGVAPQQCDNGWCWWKGFQVWTGSTDPKTKHRTSHHVCVWWLAAVQEPDQNVAASCERPLWSSPG